MVETGTTGGGFTETVVATETYTLTETGNTGTGTFTRSVVGTGTYTWSDTGAGATITSLPGSYSYSLAETADVTGAVFSQSHTGTDRYDLLQNFTDVSNTGGGNPPGNMNFYSFGRAFVDPWLYRAGSIVPWAYTTTIAGTTYLYILDTNTWLNVTGGQMVQLPREPFGVVVPPLPAPLSQPFNPNAQTLETYPFTSTAPPNLLDGPSLFSGNPFGSSSPGTTLQRLLPPGMWRVQPQNFGPHTHGFGVVLPGFGNYRPIPPYYGAGGVQPYPYIPPNPAIPPRP